MKFSPLHYSVGTGRLAKLAALTHHRGKKSKPKLVSNTK
jgi:hypothetical protein